VSAAPDGCGIKLATSPMEAIILFAIIFGGVAVLVFWGTREKEKRQSDEWERQRLSDENVLKLQAAFEERLDDNADLPDGIRWQKAYIYRHLMSKWFSVLIAKHRYDEAMSKKIEPIGCIICICSKPKTRQAF
jgi:hypothetical protein